MRPYCPVASASGTRMRGPPLPTPALLETPPPPLCLAPATPAALICPGRNTAATGPAEEAPPTPRAARARRCPPVAMLLPPLSLSAPSNAVSLSLPPTDPDAVEAESSSMISTPRPHAWQYRSLTLPLATPRFGENDDKEEEIDGGARGRSSVSAEAGCMRGSKYTRQIFVRNFKIG